MANQMIILDPLSLVTITPVVKNDEGVATNKGQPVEVPLGELIAYITAQQAG